MKSTRLFPKKQRFLHKRRLKTRCFSRKTKEKKGCIQREFFVKAANKKIGLQPFRLQADVYLLLYIFLELIAYCEGESVEATIIPLCSITYSNTIASIEYEIIDFIRNTYRDREEC